MTNETLDYLNRIKALEARVEQLTTRAIKAERRVAIGDKTIADILAVLMSDWSLDGLDKIHSIVRVHHRQILKGDE